MHVLGSSVVIRSPGYSSSECVIGLPYDKSDPSTDFKILMMDGLIEFLEVSSDETPQSVLSPVRIIKMHSIFINYPSP